MNNAKEILQGISDIILVSNELNIKAYIWGGYVQDIMEGKILREHGDIDMFIENMDKNINKLIKKLKTKNFICSYYSDMQMLILNKNNIKATLNPIIFKNTTAIWKHIGEQGFISFPKEWLDMEYKEFQGIYVLTAGYKFEYCIRTIIKYTNPNWENRIREKDIQAKEYYKKILLKNNINGEELLKKIWSYNPYWLKDGYTGYEKPVLVIGKEYK
jgi:hypothetical protein